MRIVGISFFIELSYHNLRICNVNFSFHSKGTIQWSILFVDSIYACNDFYSKYGLFKSNLDIGVIVWERIVI